MKDNLGCTGGTSETVTIKDGAETIFTGSVYHCGGVDSGNLCGNTKLLVTELDTFLPTGSEKM
jgi:hypothetical protein